jgi:hypothetical protein
MSKIYASSAETTTTKLAPVCFAMEVACGIEILREHVLRALNYLIIFDDEFLIPTLRN